MEETHVSDVYHVCPGEKCSTYTATLVGSVSIGKNREASDTVEPYVSESRSGHRNNVPIKNSDEEVTEHKLPEASIEEKCSGLEMEQPYSLNVFRETCETLSGSTEYHTRSTPTENDGSVASCSDINEPERPEACSTYETTIEGLKVKVKLSAVEEGAPVDLSMVLSQMEDAVWMEIHHGIPRLGSGNKQCIKRISRTSLLAFFDEVHAAIGGSGALPPANSNGMRGLLRGCGAFSSSRRRGTGARVAGVPELSLPEEALTEADTKRLMATLTAINSHLENMEQCVLSYRSDDDDELKNSVEDQRKQLLEMEKKMANVMSVVYGQKSRPILQTRVELMIRRLLKLREILHISSDCFTEMDVQMVLTGVKRHLRTAQGVAAKLSPIGPAVGEG